MLATGAGPDWLRSAAMDDAGTVFAPAAMLGNEDAALLMAGFDGMTLIVDDGHAYLPIDWIARERPDLADVCELVGRRVRSHFFKEDVA